MTRALWSYLIECALHAAAVVGCVAMLVYDAVTGDVAGTLLMLSMTGALCLIGWPERPW